MTNKFAAYVINKLLSHVTDVLNSAAEEECTSWVQTFSMGLFRFPTAIPAHNDTLQDTWPGNRCFAYSSIRQQTDKMASCFLKTGW